MSGLYEKYTHLKCDWPSQNVLRVTINRPERHNALTAEAHTQLTEIWRDIDRDPEIRSVIIGGAGKSFSVGGEFDLVEAAIVDFDARCRALREARDLVYNMINCSKPIVSAMQGAVAGGGLALGLMADISIAAKSARLVDGHTRLGVCAGDHAVILWPLLCGLAKAKYHLLLCETVTGEKAEQIGLVSLSVDEVELERTAISVAAKLAQGASFAIQSTKYALNNWLRQAGPAFDTSTALQMLGFTGPEPKEGLASHREKREPIFAHGTVGGLTRN